jgi:hypothetical protein
MVGYLVVTQDLVILCWALYTTNPAIIRITTYMKEGLMYLMMMLDYHLPKTLLIGCDDLC